MSSSESSSLIASPMSVTLVRSWRFIGGDISGGLVGIVFEEFWTCFSMKGCVVLKGG